MKITLQLLDQEGQVKTGLFSYDETVKPFKTTGDDLAVIGIKKMAWQAGDKIQVDIDQANQYLWVQLDETIAPTLIYLSQRQWIYTIAPDKRQLDTAFASQRHCIMVRKASTADVNAYRNLAFNPHDQVADTGAYPHASSNVAEETNPTFIAQNAIDGKLANISHGSYPYGSWGIHERADAALTIDFGRPVEINMVKLLVRSDHLERPHDGYWNQGTLEFSDGSQQVVAMNDSDTFQTVRFAPKVTSTLVLKDLIPAEESARFKALTQIEAYGYARN